VTNALGMAIEQRRPSGATVIHSDQERNSPPGLYPRAIDSGLLPSMGSVGDCFDNAVIESFWSRMQVELLNRKRLVDANELASAIFDYLEIFHIASGVTRRGVCSHRSSLRLYIYQPRQRESSDATPSKPGHPRVSRIPGAVHCSAVGCESGRQDSNLRPWSPRLVLISR